MAECIKDCINYREIKLFKVSIYTFSYIYLQNKLTIGDVNKTL